VTQVLPPRAFSADEDWHAGFDMALPCDRSSDCDFEASWLVSQHGCVVVNLCDEHMMECFREVNGIIAQLGLVRCAACEGNFRRFDRFIKAVKI